MDRRIADHLALVRERRKRFSAHRPGLLHAWVQDALALRANRAERWQYGSRIRRWLMIASLWVTTDDYAGVALYRLRVSLHAHRVPIAPWVLHRICAVLFGIRIGMGVTIREGLYLPHGSVIIDGVGYIGKYVTIAPGVTIGVKQGSFFAPQIGNGVHIGTGAKVLGDINIGPGVQIGANAVVIDDMPEHTLVAGIPARVVRSLSAEERV